MNLFRQFSLTRLGWLGILHFRLWNPEQRLHCSLECGECCFAFDWLGLHESIMARIPMAWSISLPAPFLLQPHASLPGLLGTRHIDIRLGVANGNKVRDRDIPALWDQVFQIHRIRRWAA